jgi:protein-tyrosine phosphatase
MRQIRSDLLWIGNVGDVRDLARALAAGLTAIVDVACDDPSISVPRSLVFCRFPLVDGLGNPEWLLRAAISTTAHLLRLQQPTLVACSAGMSRSVAVATAALSLTENRSPESCMEEMRIVAQPTAVSPSLWREIKAVLI